MIREAQLPEFIAVPNALCPVERGVRKSYAGGGLMPPSDGKRVDCILSKHVWLRLIYLER